MLSSFSLLRVWKWIFVSRVVARQLESRPGVVGTGGRVQKSVVKVGGMITSLCSSTSSTWKVFIDRVNPFLIPR